MKTYIPPATTAPAKGKGKATKATKPPKDENAPKRALTPFFNFQADRRPTLKQNNPDMSNTELVKALAETWRNLSEGEKLVYNAKTEV